MRLWLFLSCGSISSDHCVILSWPVQVINTRDFKATHSAAIDFFPIDFDINFVALSCKTVRSYRIQVIDLGQILDPAPVLHVNWLLIP